MSTLRGLLDSLTTLFHVDRRGRIRIPADFDAILTGSFGAAPAAGVDANRNGAAVRCEIALPIGMRLFIRIPRHALGGFADVRRCEPCEGGYLLGLEFPRPLSRCRDEFDNTLSPLAS